MAEPEDRFEAALRMYEQRSPDALVSLQEVRRSQAWLWGWLAPVLIAGSGVLTYFLTETVGTMAQGDREPFTILLLLVEAVAVVAALVQWRETSGAFRTVDLALKILRGADRITMVVRRRDAPGRSSASM